MVQDIHQIHEQLNNKLLEARKLSLNMPSAAYDLALAVSEDALTHELIPLRAEALYVLTLACRTLGQQVEAFEYIREALKIFKRTGNLNMQMQSKSLLGVLHFYCGEYQEALKQFYLARNLAIEIGHFEKLVAILNNIGEVHRKSENYSEALSTYKEAIELGKKEHAYESVGLALSNIGEVYMQLGSYKEAEETFLCAKRFIEGGEDVVVKFEWYYRMGRLSMTRGDNNQAREHIEVSETLLKSIDNKYYIVDALLLKSQVLQALNEDEEALETLNEALVISENAQSDHQLSRVYGDFYMYYEKAGDFQKALEFFKRQQMTLQKIEATNLVKKLKLLEYRHNLATVDRSTRVVQDFIVDEIEKEEKRIEGIIENMENLSQNERVLN